MNSYLSCMVLHMLPSINSCKTTHQRNALLSQKERVYVQ